MGVVAAASLASAPGASAAAPVAARLADPLRYTASGERVVLTFLQTGGPAGDQVSLYDRRGRIAHAPLGERADDGTREATLRVDGLAPGVHGLKACSRTSCAFGVHIVFDGPVDGVFAALLARPATPEERAQLAGRPLADVARLVAASPERAAGIVRELYHFHLGRPPEPAGLAHWVRHLEEGGTVLEVVGAVCGAEPKPHSVRENARCWPALDVLGEHDPDLDDLPLADAAASAAAREWVVRRVFVALLGREPELAARRFWAPAVDATVPSDELLVGVLSTEEYRDHLVR